MDRSRLTISHKFVFLFVALFVIQAIADLRFLSPFKPGTETPEPPSFVPTDIEHLRVWYDFSDLATITKDGSNHVTSVSDKSGNSYTGTGSGNLLWVSAAQNGLDVVQFNGTNSMVRATAGANIQQSSIIVIAKPTTGRQYNAVIGASVKPTGQLTMHVDDFSGSHTALGIFGAPSSQNANSGINTFTVGDWHRVLWTYDVFGLSNGGPNRIYFDRVLKGSGNIGSGTVYMNDLTVGFDAGSNGWFDFQGQMGEVLVYDKVLTLDEQIRLDNYLHDKWAFADSPPDPSLVTFTPTRPKTREVFQRSPTDSGSIIITGTTADGTSARARAVVRSGYVGTTSAWQDVPVSAGTVSGSIIADAGFYDVEIEIYVADTYLLSQTTVARVGIGTVAIIAGQSNATDMYSPLDSTPPNDAVNARAANGTWARATDPMPVYDSTTLSSVWPALGDLIFAQTGLPVGLINTAESNTFIADWLPAGLLYPRISAALATLPIGPEFFWWMHGENDASVGTTQANYRVPGQSIIDQINLDAGRTVRCGISITTHHFQATGAGVRAAQIQLGSYSGCFQGPDTDTLGTSFRYDNLHFNTTTGRAAHAALWFSTILPFL